MRIAHSKPTIGSSEQRAVRSVLSSKYLAQGQRTAIFESQLARFIGRRYALATNSGTSALHLALLALGVGQKHEVILPSYTCAAVLHAVNYTDARPVLVDVDSRDGNIDPTAVKKQVNRRTRAIIVPHHVGFPAAVDRCRVRGIPVIEDCAQGLGAVYKKKKIGAFGLISIFSFYATKMMTTGYGGMILTDTGNLFNRVRDLRQFDERSDYRPRFNYQLGDVQAVLGSVQLGRLNHFIRRRQQIARAYRRQLKNDIGSVLVPRPQARPVFYRYILRLRKGAAAFIKKMNRVGIEVKRPVYRPLHHYLKLSKKKFPGTEEIQRTSVSLPIYPGLTNRELNYIIKKANAIL